MSGKGSTLFGLVLLAFHTRTAVAQLPGSDSTTTPPTRPAHYWRDMAGGFAASLLAHEAGHIVTAYALGAHPTFGLDKGRPTVFSGINVRTDPHKQFLFSSMGLNVQAAMDEGILDIPHRRGGAFERGVLAGGIATAAFYITIGRSASVSDIDFMARTSSLSKTQLSFIYGGIAALHVVRMRIDGSYTNFFVRPAPGRGLQIGVSPGE
jgi:hypothetical protein